MSSVNDTTLTFFSKATPNQWTFVYDLYRDVFKIHAENTRGARKNGPADLIKLDIWYQEELPKIIRSRKEPQLLYEEIIQITKWKLLRGKFRPSLLDLVKTNTELAVKNATKKAFKKMPNTLSAISTLTQLKGIGLATASAILVAYSPDACPYMADETMVSTPGVEVTDYTSKEYQNYCDKINELVEKLKNLDPEGNWSPHKVELSIWTHYYLKQYNLDNLLNNMPTELSNEPTNSTNQFNDENQVDSSLNENDLENDESSHNSANLENVTQSENVSNLSNGHLIKEESSLNDQSNDQFNDQSNDQSYDQSTNLSSTNSELIKRLPKSLNNNQLNSNQLSNSNINSSNLEESSNFSSIVSTNSMNDEQSNESVQLNKLVSIEEDSSSNNDVSSTNCISSSQNTSKLTNGNNQTSSTNEVDNQLDNALNTNLKTTLSNNLNHFNNLNALNTNQFNQDHQDNNVDSNLSNLSSSLHLNTDSSEKFSSISSSCDNSNNVNSSEDSIQLNNRKRRNSSSNSSLSNLSNLKSTKSCVNTNLNLNLDDNAIFDPDSEQSVKRQKVTN